MEQVKHIKNISIENFKCFDYFSVEGFGMYNIILGDNNVGKTSFLEALLFDENISSSIKHFQGLLQFKRIVTEKKVFSENPFVFFINNFSKKKYISFNFDFFNSKKIGFKIESVNIKYLSGEDRNNLLESNFFIEEAEDLLKVAAINSNQIDYKRFNINQNFEGNPEFIPYIYSNLYYSSDLVSFFTKNFSNKDAKTKLINSLKPLVRNISNVEITLNSINQTPIIAVWLEDKDSLLPLPMFGDGTIRLFRIIMEITMCSNKYLCIDEIDTGIHYSRYKDFSRIVLQTAAANNVQLFISTHNNEFLKSFKEVLEEKDFQSYQNDTKCFTLKKLPNESIKAYRYNFEEFEFAIEQENELR